MTCRVSLIREGAIERPSSRTWQRDASLGANTLTIGGGHTLDTLISLVGTVRRSVAGVVSAEAKQWLESDTNRLVDVTSPDNMLVSGRLAKGGVASVHVSDTPWGRSGLGLEVYGRDGVLIASGDRAPQYAEIDLRGARGSEALAEMALPAKYVYVPSDDAEGRPVHRRPDVPASSPGRSATDRERTRTSPPRSRCTGFSTRSEKPPTPAVWSRSCHRGLRSEPGRLRRHVAAPSRSIPDLDPGRDDTAASRTIARNRMTGTDDPVTMIYLNGEARELEGTPTVADVARLFPLTTGVAIARNGEVVPRSAWAVTAIEPSDRLEVLSIAPGG